MDSCSENSFTWTDTSNESTDSNSVVADDNTVDKTAKLNNKHEKKRKSKVLNNSCNGSEVRNNTTLKDEKEQLCSEALSNGSMKRKMVKEEPQSDCDMSKKKKKIKHMQANDDRHAVQDSACHDESYLDLRVKQEQLTTPSSVTHLKKKRKHSSMDTNDPQSTAELKYEDDGSDLHEVEASENIFQAAGRIKSKKKKKKSKKRSDSECPDEIETDYKMNGDNSDMNNQKQINKSANKSSTNSILDNNTFLEESGCEDISAIQCDAEDNFHTISFNDSQLIENGNKKKNNSHYKSPIVNQCKIANNDFDGELQISTSLGKRTPCISDRLRFEDEDDLELEYSHAHENKEEKTSAKLKKFIKINNNMKLVSQKLQHSSILSCDDEIWIVKCPKELDIQAFGGTELNIHGKCKVKVGGQTYDGSLEDEQCDTAPVLSLEHGRYEIENLPLCGIINFRKRIPKAHFRDDNMMVNNQTNFIPLPETKCRHPLFGSNYKKALKLPTAIAERLNEQSSAERGIHIEKKKKKKHKRENIPNFDETDSKNECITKSEPELSLETTEKRKKKRKREEDEGPAPKKIKKIKHDPESAEAWESEKAIEQNLFNF